MGTVILKLTKDVNNVNEFAKNLYCIELWMEGKELYKQIFQVSMT